MRLVYREAEDLLPVVRELLSRPAGPVEPTWEALTESELSASHPGSQGAYTRAQADDGIITADGRILLLHATELTVLSGLGAALWFALDVAGTPTGIVGRLAETVEIPEDAEQIVVRGLEDLVARGLLQH